jgi:hypothetical protein
LGEVFEREGAGDDLAAGVDAADLVFLARLDHADFAFNSGGLGEKLRQSIVIGWRGMRTPNSAIDLRYQGS